MFLTGSVAATMQDREEQRAIASSLQPADTSDLGEYGLDEGELTAEVQKTQAEPLKKALEAKFAPGQVQQAGESAKPDMGKAITEIPKALAGGVEDTMNIIVNGVKTVGEFMGIVDKAPAFSTDYVSQPTTPEAKVLRAASKYVAPLAVAPLTPAGVGASALVEGVVGFLGTDPKDQRISDLIQDIPYLRNPIAAQLATKPGETEMEARIKNAMEAALTVGMAGAIGAGAKASIHAMKARKTTDAIASGVAVRKAGANILTEAEVVTAESKMGANADIPVADKLKQADMVFQKTLQDAAVRGENSDAVGAILDDVVASEQAMKESIKEASKVEGADIAKITEEANQKHLSTLDKYNKQLEKDYFTSARPWEQKGPSITVPLGTTAPVELTSTTGTNGLAVRADTHAALGSDSGLKADSTGGGTFASDGDVPMVYDPNGTLFADLSSASAVTVNVLREALALQRFEEARARFGSRYVEYLRYLGVRSSDARLQRPEFLGGGRYPIQFSEVLQTAEGTDPVGELRGHGIGVARSNRYRRFFEEHGVVLTLASVRPRTMYGNGLHKQWSRSLKEDFWQKELELIGQEEVLNKEVYVDDSGPNDVFGYNDRYYSYRRHPSSVSADFRTTLNDWHLARIVTGKQIGRAHV